MTVTQKTQQGRPYTGVSSLLKQRERLDEKTEAPSDSVWKRLGAGIERLFDLTLSGLAIVPASAAIGLIFIIYRHYNRGTGSFFYKGERLGKKKKPFHMYKIRTLKEIAEQQFSEDILTPGSGLELNFGKFLRATRLDELPQLYNILKGEMRFIGPRPLRPAIYHANCRFIPGYDLRFSVKPGLFGYSQILTPHTAPKRVRAFIDNRFISQQHRFLFDLFFIAWAVAALMLNLIRESAFTLREYCRIVTRRGVFRDRRKLRRISGQGIGFSFNDPTFATTLPYNAKVLSLNNDAVALASDILLYQNQKIYGTLEVWTPEGKAKRVQCKAFLYKKRPYDDVDALPWFYVLFYLPISDVNRYILGQYILKQSISQYLAREYRLNQAPRNQRRMRRITGTGIILSIHDRKSDRVMDAHSRLVDINGQSLRMASTLELELGDEIDFILTIRLTRKKKAKMVRCNAWVYRKIPLEDATSEMRTYILNYNPVSEVNRFLLEKYVLKQSISN